MNIQIIAVGKKMPSWAENANEEYFKRIQHECNINIIKIPTPTRTKTSNIEKIKKIESSKILKEVKSGMIISLDERGKLLSTNELAKKIKQWNENQVKNINLIIGGPDGLDKEIIDKSNEVWSLSKLTFPHALARVVLMEQLYRAYSIINNHPYHRE